MDPNGNANAQPGPSNTFTECTIGGSNPRTNPNDIACPAPTTVAGAGLTGKANGDDKASSLAYANGIQYPTTVTVYACYRWLPPMSGFLFIPQTIVLRAVITEAMQRQQ